MLLRGKLAVVAGFGAGMARQVAVSLAREGADLVVYGGAEPVMVSAAGEIAALGRKALCVPAAVPDRAASVSLANRIQEIFGRVDVLVHNSPLPSTPPTHFEDADLDAWRAIVDADIFGPLVLTQSLLPLLRASTDGRVIVIGTRSGAAAPDGFGAHTAAQAALTALAQTLARELGPTGIRVNVVHPGASFAAAGPWAAGAAGGAGVAGEGEAARTASAAPTEEEVAGAVVFLASPLSRAVTGQALHVDAGYWIA
jgi:NAD(P)-dependent dehydrogenase (short-subunit alcohol dehydrogenase family)